MSERQRRLKLLNNPKTLGEVVHAITNNARPVEDEEEGVALVVTIARGAQALPLPEQEFLLRVSPKEPLNSEEAHQSKRRIR